MPIDRSVFIRPVNFKCFNLSRPKFYDLYKRYESKGKVIEGFLNAL